MHCRKKVVIYDPETRFSMGFSENDSLMPCGTLFCPSTGRCIGRCVLDESQGTEKRDVWCALVSRNALSDVVCSNRNLVGTENLLILDHAPGGNNDEFVRIGVGQIDQSIDWYGIDSDAALKIGDLDLDEWESYVKRQHKPMINVL